MSQPLRWKFQGVASGCAFVTVLDGYTLSDLVKPKASLRTLLSLTPSDNKQASTRASKSRRTGVRRAHEPRR